MAGPYLLNARIWEKHHQYGNPRKQENNLYRPAFGFCAARVPRQRGFGRNGVEPDGMIRNSKLMKSKR